MADSSIELLKKLANAATEGDRQDIVFLDPQLLSARVQEELTGDVRAMASAEREQLVTALAYLQEVRQFFEANPGQYPIGPGPLERLWLRAEQGEIRREYAERLAQEADILQALSLAYVHGISSFCVRSAYDGNWRQSVPLQKLLKTAVDAVPTPAEKQLLQQPVYLDWVEIVRAALVDMPDGRLYRQALAAGDEIIARTPAEDTQFRGDMLHRLGTLHLDPYTAGRRSTNYANDIYRWQQRFLTEAGHELVNVPEEEWRMPSPEEGLELAEKYLRQAVEAREGNYKGLSLKALVQCLEWRELLEQPVDLAELKELCQQALQWLDPAHSPEHRLSVLATLNRHDWTVETAEVDRMFELSLDAYVRWLGVPGTIDLVQQAASVLQSQQPLRSLELIHRARGLFKHYGGERAQINLWLSELNLIAQALAPKIPPQLPAGGLDELVRTFYEQSKAEQWDVRALSAALISVSAHAERWDEELAGLDLLDEAARVAPLFADEYAEALDFLRANLLLGVGVNGVNTEDWPLAVKAYTQALRRYLEMDLTDTATDCLRRIDDLATRYGTEVAMQVVAGLAPLTMRLESKLGEPATTLIQHVCKRTVAAMMNQSINPELLFFLLQIAKGGRFAALLYSGSRYKWHEDDQGLRLLEQIGQLEADLPPDSPVINPPDPAALLDKDMILTAYTRPDERQTGDSLHERLSNLQHSYDAHLNDRLLTAIPDQESLFLSTKDVQAALDKRTVLLNFYLGASLDGRIAVYALLITRDEVRAGVTVHEFPDSQVSMGDGERALLMSPFAVTVQSLRQYIVAEPGPRLVSRKAGETLAVDLRGYLGHLVENLAELNEAGKDHLCIVPHGPLHYYPFHLLGEVGQPLADNWIVTYLPNLHLLISRRGQPAVRRYRGQSLAAIGLSFEADARPGLAAIPQSVSETKKVAAIFETTPLLEEQATEEAVLNAFSSSRYVHLSTHGWHNVTAPAFQCLYLTPEAEADGRLYAHELLSLDLRGLEILTLSACETALGRFDSGDNLRGLPASFLLAGTSTIIGTLWPVEANASEHFFSALYREINGGAARLDAFATAQRDTRAAFPKYRDWGPFYLMGDWL